MRTLVQATLNKFLKISIGTKFSRNTATTKKEHQLTTLHIFVEKISISVVFIWKQLKMLLKHFLLTIFSTRNSVKLVLILMRKVLNDRRIAFNFQTSSRAALRARENSGISVSFCHSAAIAFAFASRSQPTTLTHRFN